MNTQRGFELIHTPETKYETDKERRTWVEATWYFKRDRRKELTRLRK